MLNDTALKLDVFDALDQAVENGYWTGARLDEEIAEDLVSTASVIAWDMMQYSQDFEAFTEDDLLPHVADWKHANGPR